jgi:hypothetical protein
MPRWRRSVDAIANFNALIKSVIRTVTPVAVDTPRRYEPSTTILRTVELNEGQPVPLRGPGRISLQVRLRYRLNQDDDGWWVTIAAYQYALFDEREQEIVAYHWHPEGESHVVTPHLHLGAGAQVGRAELTDAHIHTGLVSLTAAVRLSIEVFSAQPSRRQWDRTLREADAALLES